MGTEIDFNTPPYFDDHDPEKRFHRIVFRPSLPVQGRELTQLQTILQEQIERFGNHVFKDGSIVDGCAITYFANVHYLSLADKFNTNQQSFVTDYDNSYLITNSTNSNTAVRATIKIAKNGVAASYPDTNRIYFDYISTGKDGSNNDVYTFSPGDTLYFYSNAQNKLANLNGGFLVDTINTLASNGSFTSNGVAYCVSVSDGIIFQKGFFQKVDPQVITVKDFDANVSGYVVGFDTTETIVDEYEDISLVDNALGYPNENAPGAHRLRLTPTLVSKTRTETANNKNFFAIVEFDGSQPTEQQSDPAYNVVESEMAKRTFDESGDYVIKPFQIETRVSANSETFYYEISPGIAYVRGHRIEKIGPSKVESYRASNTSVSQNQIVVANYGNYVYVNELGGSFDIENFGEVTLLDQPQYLLSQYAGMSAANNGVEVGKANVRAIEFENGNRGRPESTYLLYLHNIRMNSGKSFSQDVKSIYANSAAFGVARADLVLENGVAVLKEANRNSLLFDLGLKATKRLTNADGINDTTYIYNQVKQVTLQSSGETSSVSIDSAGPGASERLYDSGTVTGNNLDKYTLYLSANAFSANQTGTMAITSGNNIVVGTSTSFTSQLSANSLVRIWANTTNQIIRRVISISNNTYLTLDAAPSVSNTASQFQRFWTGGSPFPLSSVTISSNTSLTGTSGIALDSGSQNAYFSYPILRNQAGAIPKVINKNRFVKIDCSNNVGGVTGPWNLGLVDVHKIRKVYVGNTSTGYANTNPDRSSWFIVDSGQRDDVYDHGRLIVSPQYTSQINANTRILVELDAFTANTSASVGFFSVDSYRIDDANTANTTAIQTIEIPWYKGQDLRNFIDFRGRKVNSANISATAIADATVNPPVSNTSFSLTGSGQYLAAPDTAFTCDVEYYLPRYDIVTIDPRGTFGVTRGSADLNPRPPFVENDQTRIAEVYVPPYPSATKREADLYSTAEPIRIKLKTNKRYTMKDIGTLEERIKRMEFYTVLNVLEQQARDITVPDANGLDRFKNGIFADPFNSHIIGNVADIEYKIAIDPQETVARPYFDKHDIDFTFVSGSSANVVQTGPLVTLTYDSSAYITQRFATKYRVTTESLWKWRGFIDLYPSYDFYRDEDTAPNVNTSLDLAAPWEQFQNSPFGSMYGDWRNVSVQSATLQNTNQTGNLITTTTTTTTNTTQQRTIESIGVNSFTETYELGTYVKDVSIQPYMRSRLVAFVSRNMKPNTRLYPFFDDINVSVHCAPGVLSGVTQVEAGLEDRVVNRTGAWGDPLVSDANGFVCGVFRIPAETFRTGDRLFQLVNVDDLVTGGSAIITNGKAIFTADNFSVTKQTSTLTVRQPLIYRMSTIDTRIQTNVSTNVSVIDITPISSGDGGGGDGGDGGSCFVAGTKITMADGSVKNIEDILIGDIVRGFESDNLVIGYNHPMLDEDRTPTLYGFNGSKAFVTAEHPFLTTRGWKSAEPSETKRLKPHLGYLNVTELEVGDEIIKVDGSTELLKSIEKYENQPQQRVYNLVLNGDHTYYADGLLAHNRDPIAQSFTIENAPSNVSSVFIVGVGVFFKQKDPTLGCQIFICEMVNGYPNMSRIVGKGWLASADIDVSDDASVETIFTLEHPICLLSSQDYAFVVQPDGYSPEYTIWVGETGEFDVDTSEQVFSNPYSGTMFVSANKKTWTAIQKEDIKFNIYRANFTANSGHAIFRNENDEFITLSGFTRNSATNAIQIGDVVYSVNSAANLGDAANVVNHTLKTGGSPTGRIQYINEANGYLWLDSSIGGFSNTTNPAIAVYRPNDPTNIDHANTSTYIGVGTIARIENLKYHAVVPKFGVLQPSKTRLTYAYKGTSNSNAIDSSYVSAINELETEFIDTERHVMSKSNEVASLSSNKSAEFRINLETDSSFVSPVINLSRKSMLFIENLINNDVTNEHTRYGNAASKYVSKKVVLADGQEAEDLKIWITAYRPSGTDVKVYAKFRNAEDPEPFEDKVWTLMQYDNGGEFVYSSPTNNRDFIEYEFSVPSVNSVATAAFANTGVDTYNPLPGTISVANNSSTITGTGTSFNTDFTVGDTIRIVSGTYMAVRTITSIANATSMTLNQGVQAANSAALYYIYSNNGNEGIVEYKSSSGARYIGYKEFAIKLVLLSSNPVIVPRLNDVRAICLQV